MHDGIAFEKAGIPAAVIATTEFENAACAQADALGLGGFQAVFVEHPIQPLTPDEVRQRADAAFDRIIATLTSRSLGA